MKYLVQGNYRVFSITLTQNDGSEVTPYVPTETDEIRISLNGARRYEYTDFEQTGNVLTFEDNGCLVVGLYQLEVKIVDSESHKLRCMYREQIRVVASNDDIPTDASFDTDNVELNAELSVTAKVVVDDHLDASSENPVQNKVVQEALDGKGGSLKWYYDKDLVELCLLKELDGEALIETVLNPATQSLAGVMTATDKQKLDQIEAGATKTIVDTALNQNSNNAISNKAVATALGEKQDTLESGKTIKTINGNPLLGSGDIELTAEVDTILDEASENPVQNKVIATAIKSEQTARKNADDELQRQIDTIDPTAKKLRQKDMYDRVAFMAQQKILDITLKGENDFIYKEGTTEITIPAGQTRYIKIYTGNVPQISLFAHGSCCTELVRVDALPNGFNFALEMQSGKVCEALEYICPFYTRGTSYTINAPNLKEFDGFYLQPYPMHAVVFRVNSLSGEPMTFPAADFDFRGCTSLQNMFMFGGRIKDFGGFETEWDVSSVANMASMFNGCTQLTALDVSKWDVSSVANMTSMFHGCLLVELDFSNKNFAALTSFESLLVNMDTIRTIDFTNSTMPKVANYRGMINGYCGVVEVLGALDFASCTNATDFYNGAIGNLRRLQIDNMGKAEELTLVTITARYWGVDTDEITGTLQGLLNTIENAFDRASAGYTACTVKLHANTLNNTLTPEQVAAWTAKGFTLTT